jgi:hypothetical protein
MFRVWESKTLVLAKAKVFYATLTTDIGSTITYEEYEFGIFIDKVSGYEHLTTLTEIGNYTSTQNAFAYLSLMINYSRIGQFLIPNSWYVMKKPNFLI